MKIKKQKISRQEEIKKFWEAEILKCRNCTKIFTPEDEIGGDVISLRIALEKEICGECQNKIYNKYIN